MSRRAYYLFLAAGAGAFVLLIARIGPARIAADVRGAGWVLLPVVLLFAGVYALSAEAWRLTIRERPSPITRLRGFAITAWSYALNYVTPMVSVGGEPFKIAAAAHWLGIRGAAASVISQRLLHFQAHVLFFLTGVLLAWFLLPRSAVGGAALLATFAGLLAVGTVLALIHRRGAAVRLLAALQRMPIARRRAAWLETKRAGAVEVDARITALYHHDRARYLAALALEYAARCLTVVEILLIARAIGIPLDYATAFLIASFVSLVVNLFFFIPFALGTREGGLAVIFALLGLPPALGVVTSVIGRLRELAWIAIGLALGAIAAPPARSTTATSVADAQDG